MRALFETWCALLVFAEFGKRPDLLFLMSADCKDANGAWQRNTTSSSWGRDSVSAVLAHEFARRLEQCTLVSSSRRVCVARFFLPFFLCCEAPSGLRRSSNRWCPGTVLSMNDTKVSVPLRASTAHQSAVSPSEQLISKRERHFFRSCY